MISALSGVALVAMTLAPDLPAQPGLPRFERGDCLVNGDWAREVQRECGWLVVPESRDRPTASTVRLAVEIFHAREPSGAPPLVLLHGGPGGPGGIALFSAGIAKSPLLLHRDIVIYDQRGAGASEPKLCPDYDIAVDSASNLRAGVEKEKKLDSARRACTAELDKKGVDRLAYNTEANVADLIDLRRTLGYGSWDIRGPSYGGRLAQEAMVRDGAATRSVQLVTPLARSFSMQSEQPLSTQRAFERLFAACTLQPSCREAFPEVDQDFQALYASLKKSPLPVAVPLPDGRSDTIWLDGDRLVAGIRERLGTSTGLGRIPLLLHELRAGDRSRAARELVGHVAAPGRLANRALRELVNCDDDGGSKSLKTLKSVNARARPPFRRAVDRHCEEWLPRSADVAVRDPVRSDIPTLILTGYFDDRTPTEQVRRIAATLSRASLVEFPDEGHDARPSRCHAAIALQFLEDPTRPPDTSCLATIPPITFETTWEQAKGP
ncbi:MAG TPA: alpha/beta hydrolase [Candidatus Polarisedimenticolia bacterium]|nr:alpha/beta hydrolase [Candidatus Polarisedimenticolia bacterium]